MVDFKARVLDFIAIYVKEAEQAKDQYPKIVKNLLKALRAAQLDGNLVLARRVENVLSSLTVGDSGKGQKVLLTELMVYILKPAKVKNQQPTERQKDLQKAYMDLFLR